jgi:hypothetical protein
MAALSAKRRASLPASAFAYPATRTYPIDTPARARNALARAAQKGTRGSYKRVAAAVRRRYGDKITTTGPTKGVLHRAGTRKRRAAAKRTGWGRARRR